MPPISRRELLKTMPAALIVLLPDYGFSKPALTNLIIDMHHGNPIEPSAAKSTGVVAIIHKATEGGNFKDKKYHEQKEKAKALGLLWGAYHFSNNSDVNLQVRNYLDYAKPEDDEVICLDFEHNKGKEMTLVQAEQFISTIYQQKGRYPMLYGGAWLREQVGKRPNELLAKCPLWYRRYASRPRELPTQIWPTYTLWQYTDGEVGGEPRSVGGLACDRSFFQGSVEELKKAWPFTRRTG